MNKLYNNWSNLRKDIDYLDKYSVHKNIYK